MPMELSDPYQTSPRKDSGVPMYYDRTPQMNTKAMCRPEATCSIVLSGNTADIVRKILLFAPRW
jgi:hypothetical protein